MEKAHGGWMKWGRTGVSCRGLNNLNRAFRYVMAYVYIGLQGNLIGKYSGFCNRRLGLRAWGREI